MAWFQLLRENRPHLAIFLFFLCDYHKNCDETDSHCTDIQHAKHPESGTSEEEQQEMYRKEEEKKPLGKRQAWFLLCLSIRSDTDDDAPVLLLIVREASTISRVLYPHCTGWSIWIRRGWVAKALGMFFNYTRLHCVSLRSLFSSRMSPLLYCRIVFKCC